MLSDMKKIAYAVFKDYTLQIDLLLVFYQEV